MSPTSPNLQHLLVAVAILCPVMVAVGWRRRRQNIRGGHRALSTLMVVALVLLGQLSAVGAVAVNLNSQLGIFLDWRSLLAAANQGPSGLTTALGVGGGPAFERLTPHEKRLLARQGWFPDAHQPPAGDGSYRDYIATGANSGIRDLVVVWIPQGMKEKELHQLPVVMNLSGAYGGPSGFLKASAFGSHAQALIRSGRVPPFVAIAPMVNVRLPHDTECFDFPGGPQAFTWLASDMKIWAHRTLGVSMRRSRWTVEGMSTGGYCAAKLQTADSAEFSAAASVAGYFTPEPDATTLDLQEILQRDPQARQQTDVAWLIRNQTPPEDLRLLAISSPADPQSHPQFQQFARMVRGRPGVTLTSLPGLSHTNATMGAVQDRVLPFLLHGIQ